MSTLSACIIMKNEEKNILRCLKSIENIANEIIIVDTGSNDKSVELVKDLPKVKLYTFQWINDFSAARNYALSKANKKWVLFIDADEELCAETLPFLKNRLKAEKKEAISFKLVNLINGKESTSNYTVRLFRRRPYYRFQGKIHEQITPCIYKKSGMFCISETDIKLYHYGYDGDTTDLDAKIQRNLDILNSFEDHEKDGFYYYNLATEYYRKNDYTLAIKYYNLAEITPSFVQNYILKLSINKGQCLIFLNRLEEAIEHFLKYTVQFPTFRDLFFFIYSCYIKLKDYKSAYKYIVIYKNMSIGNYPDLYFDKKHDIDKIICNLEKL